MTYTPVSYYTTYCFLKCLVNIQERIFIDRFTLINWLMGAKNFPTLVHCLPVMRCTPLQRGTHYLRLYRLQYILFQKHQAHITLSTTAYQPEITSTRARLLQMVSLLQMKHRVMIQWANTNILYSIPNIHRQVNCLLALFFFHIEKHFAGEKEFMASNC